MTFQGYRSEDQSTERFIPSLMEIFLAERFRRAQDGYVGHHVEVGHRRAGNAAQTVRGQSNGAAPLRVRRQLQLVHDVEEMLGDNA